MKDPGLAYRFFGNLARITPGLTELGYQLEKARIELRPEAYRAQLMFRSTLTFIGLLFWLATLLFILPLPLQALAKIGLAVAMPLLGAALVWYFGESRPQGVAKARGRRIETGMPDAVRYLAAVASSGITPQQAFFSLGQQEEVYGEVTHESRRLARDLMLFGRSLPDALRRGAMRSPSPSWAELLHGAQSTLESGGRLPDYFEDRAKRLQFEAQLEQESFIETMGLMAETYVTAAVAGPLFLIVLLTVMVLMGSGSFFALAAICYGLLPFLGVAFTIGLSTMVPEA